MAKKQTTKPAKESAPTLSPEVVVPPPVETPPEVLGFFPPAAPSLIEHSIDAPIVIEPPVLIEHGAPSLPASESPSLDSDHPAIAIAQRARTGSGGRAHPGGRYVLPAPPEILKSV